MKLFTLIFLITCPLFIQAKSLEIETEISAEAQVCLAQYAKNPLIRTIYPDITSDKAYTFFKEIIHYCKCDGKVVGKESLKRQKDWVSYAFEDKTQMLQERDLCATETLSPENIKLHYQARFVQWFSPQIDEKISNHIPKGSQLMAGKDKWVNFLECAHFDIANKCSKITSLSTTYNCIKQQFQTKTFEKIHNQCMFHFYDPKKEELHKVLFNKDMMI